MILALSTWPEIESRLQRSKTVVIPIGSNEQHGPTGLLGTDWLCPQIIAHEAHRRGDILVAPTFNIGMAQHHLGFPGTISLRPATFQAAICDWVDSLSRHGLSYMLKLRCWWQLPGIGGLADELFPVGHGSHATPSEIAITQSAYPDSRSLAGVAGKRRPVSAAGYPCSRAGYSR